jgi:lysophospholipase L1-like esterase
MELKGKKICFLGDSITEGAVASKIENCYWKKLGEKTGANVLGFGIGGTRVAPKKIKTESYDNLDFQIRYKEIPSDADVIVVFGGTNDFGHGDAPFGKLSDKAPFTFCGAFYTLLKNLIEAHPEARIVVMTPLHRLSEKVVVNEIGLPTPPLKEYVKAEKEIAADFSIPVLDLWANSGMQPSIPIIKETFMPDGLHPNDKGHERIADLLIGFLKNL